MAVNIFGFVENKGLEGNTAIDRMGEDRVPLSFLLMSHLSVVSVYTSIHNSIFVILVYYYKRKTQLGSLFLDDSIVPSVCRPLICV